MNIWKVVRSILCCLYLFQKCCPHLLFMKCGQHFWVVRIFKKLSASDIWKKCCPHFLIMKCGQHLKLSACCPVIRSCPHFINTPWNLSLFHIVLYYIIVNGFLNIIEILYHWCANIGARPDLKDVWLHKILELNNVM